jgi:hypothetical protein
VVRHQGHRRLEGRWFKDGLIVGSKAVVYNDLYHQSAPQRRRLGRRLVR